MPSVPTNSTFVFQWSTGTKGNEKIHSVALEIPPTQASLKFSKNVQKQVSTQGWVVTHGLPNLGVLTASGVSYQPYNEGVALSEGFNKRLGLSGLELLNSAYISSGRLSSSTELTTSINSTLARQVGSNLQNISVPTTVSTITQRVNQLNQISAKSQQIGQVQPDGTIVYPETETSGFTQANIDSMKNTLTADVYGADLTPLEKQGALDKINGLTVLNVDFAYKDFENYSLTIPNLYLVNSKYDYLYNYFRNQNQNLNIPGLDPSVATYLRRDPFAYLKSTSGSAILNQIVSVKPKLTDLLISQQNTQADDWVITVLLFWGEKVFLGHFEAFDMSQQASFLNLWNWSFTYVIQDAWLLKDDKIIPFTKAFDPSVTQQYAPGSRTDEYRNRNNPLERILAGLGF